MKQLDREYQDFVQHLKKPAEDIHLTNLQKDVIHMSLGVAGESGELVDEVKKCVVRGTEFNINNIIKEMGDLEYYLEGLRHTLCISREIVIKTNMDKLKKRFPNGYSPQDCINRKDVAEGMTRGTIKGRTYRSLNT